MLSGGLQLLYQSALNPELIAIAAQAGWVPDFQGWMQLLTDSFGLPPMQLYRQGQPQELQQMQMQKLMPEILKQQMQAQRLQAHAEVSDSKDDTILIKTLLDKLVTPQASHAFLDKYMGSDLGKLDQKALTSGQPKARPSGAGTA